DPLCQPGQDRLVDGMAPLLRLAHRPDYEAGVVTGDAVVLLFPGRRVSGQEGEAAIDRRVDVRRLVAEILGRCRPRKGDHDDGDDGSHMSETPDLAGLRQCKRHLRYRPDTLQSTRASGAGQ